VLFRSLNLDYFPPIPKINFFDSLFHQYQDTLNYNEKKANVLEERKFQEVTFENIYRRLDKYNYTITAFNLAKVIETYAISTTLAHRFLLLNTSAYNATTLKKLYTNLNPSAERDIVEKILTEYTKILQEYSNYNDAYYKKLRNFEERLKIITD
jgi:hypothetical protein